MKRLERLVDWPIGACLLVAMAAAVAMMFHVVADVVSRFFFNAPFSGTIEVVSAYYMVAISLLPLAHVTRDHGQITVELFTTRMSPSGRMRLDRVVGVVTLLYLALLTWKTGAEAVRRTGEGELKETAAGFLDVWPSRWILPIGFAAMALYVIMCVIRGARATA